MNAPQDNDELEHRFDEACDNIRSRYDQVLVSALGMKAALQEISRLCPPYTGEYDEFSSVSDFSHSQDYADEMLKIHFASIGDIARAELAKQAPADPRRKEGNR